MREIFFNLASMVVALESFSRPHPLPFRVSYISVSRLHGRIPRRKGAQSVYEELANLEEKGVPLLVVTAQNTDEVAKPMEENMKELLVR